MPDTQAPSVQASANPTTVYWANGTATTITATTSDNRGVVGRLDLVVGSRQRERRDVRRWSRRGPIVFDPAPDPTPVPPGSQITFVVTARDAAGNTATSTVIVQVSS